MVFSLPGGYWLLTVLKTTKKRRFQSKAVRFFSFLGGWGGEHAKICASNDINDNFFWVAAHDLETQIFMTSGETRYLRLGLVLFSLTIFTSLKTNIFFHQGRDHFGYGNAGNTSSSEPTIDFQGSMDANDSSTCRWLLISGKTIDSANTDANYRRCQKCEKPPENHSTSILFICIRISWNLLQEAFSFVLIECVRKHAPRTIVGGLFHDAKADFFRTNQWTLQSCDDGSEIR